MPSNEVSNTYVEMSEFTPWCMALARVRVIGPREDFVGLNVVSSLGRATSGWLIL
jgi:hypothetical protein